MTYIMPAGPIGATVYYVMRGRSINEMNSMGLGEIRGFIDNVKGRDIGAEFCSLPIFTPETADRNAKVIVASFRFGKAMIQQLRKLGFNYISQADEFLTLENTSEALIEMKKDNIEQRYKLEPISSQLNSFFINSGNPESLTISKLEFVVTQRCTLRCRGCCALMHFYTNPIDLDTDTVVKSVDRLFAYVDFVRIVNIIGGEPLLSKGLYNLLERLIDFRSRIGELTMTTNGTIIPDESLLLLMKKANLRLVVSDYGALSKKKNELINKARLIGVRCDSQPDLYWTAGQSFSDGNNSPEETFENCSIYCAQVMNGKLYYCNFSAHGDALRGFPFNSGNYVDLLDSTTTKKIVKSYIERNCPLPACHYCIGYDTTRERIPIAEQLKEPQPYKRYD